MGPIQALLVPHDAHPMVVELYGNEDSRQLSQLQQLVGGLIEAVYGRSPAPWHGYCDEEGKLKGKPVNITATTLARHFGWPEGDVLVGDVVFLAETPDGGEASVPDELVAWAAA